MEPNQPRSILIVSEMDDPSSYKASISEACTAIFVKGRYKETNPSSKIEEEKIAECDKPQLVYYLCLLSMLYKKILNHQRQEFIDYFKQVTNPISEKFTLEQKSEFDKLLQELTGIIQDITVELFVKNYILSGERTSQHAILENAFMFCFKSVPNVKLNKNSLLRIANDLKINLFIQKSSKKDINRNPSFPPITLYKNQKYALIINLEISKILLPHLHQKSELEQITKLTPELIDLLAKQSISEVNEEAPPIQTDPHKQAETTKEAAIFKTIELGSNLNMDSVVPKEETKEYSNRTFSPSMPTIPIEELAVHPQNNNTLSEPHDDNPGHEEIKEVIKPVMYNTFDDIPIVKSEKVIFESILNFEYGKLCPTNQSHGKMKCYCIEHKAFVCSMCYHEHNVILPGNILEWVLQFAKSLKFIQNHNNEVIDQIEKYMRKIKSYIEARVNEYFNKRKEEIARLLSPSTGDYSELEAIEELANIHLSNSQSVSQVDDFINAINSYADKVITACKLFEI